MEQLQDPELGGDLAERRHGGVVEAGIGLGDHLAQVLEARIAFQERPHHAVGDLVVIEAGHVSDFLRAESRPILRHIEAAIAGEPGEQRPFEEKRGGLAPRTHIFHGDL
jgi:hypothetical protein